MAILSKLRISVYNITVRIYPFLLRKIYKMNIGEGSIISRRARLDRGVNPKGIHIGNHTFVTGRVVVLAHDDCRKLKSDTYIGNNCFIGINSIIMPGVRIGNEVIVGAGSVVTKDIPDNCIVAGNPAKVIREGIKCDKLGRLIN